MDEKIEIITKYHNKPPRTDGKKPGVDYVERTVTINGKIMYTDRIDVQMYKAGDDPVSRFRNWLYGRVHIVPSDNTDTDNTQKQMESKQNTIRNLRREIRQLKSLLKTKDRLLSAQKSFYEEMNRFNETKAKTDEKKIESAVYECLKRILINGIETN